jgi:hypothetical protein
MRVRREIASGRHAHKLFELERRRSCWYFFPIDHVNLCGYTRTTRQLLQRRRRSMLNLDSQFPIPIDDSLARMATVTVFLGAVLFRLTDWATVGWAAVALGIMVFWLAHQVAIAPYSDALPPAT